MVEDTSAGSQRAHCLSASSYNQAVLNSGSVISGGAKLYTGIEVQPNVVISGYFHTKCSIRINWMRLVISKSRINRYVWKVLRY